MHVSHFSVTVVLDAEKASEVLEAGKNLDGLLEAALAPFYEGLEGPRRVDEQWTWSEGESPFGPDPAGEHRGLSWISDEVKTENSWEALYQYLKDDQDIEFDPQRRTLTTFTTYNPQSKWDWWVIGGRWQHYYLSKASGSKVNYVMAHDLDVEGMQDAAMEKAQRLWTRYNNDIFAIYGRPIPWSDFVKRVEDETDPMDINAARIEYHAQDAVREIRSRRDDEDFGPFAELEPYLGTLSDHLVEVRDAAVPTYALLTKEGEWVEPGRMYMFGMSTETDESKVEYHEKYMKYIANLNPIDVLVCVDAHI